MFWIWKIEYKTGSLIVSAPYLMKHTFIITSPIIVITIIRHHKIMHQYTQICINELALP